MLSTGKILTLIGMGVVLVGMFIGLPILREFVWGKEGPTTFSSLNYDPVLKAEEEEQIQAAMKVDISRYDRTSDTRYLPKLPATIPELEATFRIRKADRCEKIASGENMLSLESQLTGKLLSRQNVISSPATRRPVMSISLDVGEEDRRGLPQLSKNQIVRFLETSWISLQSRLYLDLEKNEWRLHYRPLAAQGSFGGDPRTHSFEAAVDKTLDDIRGIGILKPTESAENESVKQTPEPAAAPLAGIGDSTGKGSSEKLPPVVKKQTAAWLFRYESQPVGEAFPRKEYEFVFVHVVPRDPKDETGDLWRTHLFFTTEGRRTLHYFAPETLEKLPDDPKQTSLQANVHFTKYAGGGLSPTDSVTRSIAVNSTKFCSITQVEEFLKSNNIAGEWHENVPLVLDTIVGGL